MRHPARLTAALGAALMLCTSAAQAGVVFGLPTAGLEGGVFRWDAAPREIAGNERSLNGGLRYAVSTGSLDGFRDQFAWDAVPTSAAFAAAVQGAFNAWTVVDPVSKFGSTLSFVYDATTNVAVVAGGGSANSNGAEIDLVATNDARFWNPGNNVRQGETWFNGIGATATLTSGVADYSFSRAISGADIYLNNNPGAVYSLPYFRACSPMKSAMPSAWVTWKAASTPAPSSTTTSARPTRPAR